VVRAHPTVPHKSLKLLNFWKVARYDPSCRLSKGSTEVPKAPRVTVDRMQLIPFGIGRLNPLGACSELSAARRRRASAARGHRVAICCVARRKWSSPRPNGRRPASAVPPKPTRTAPAKCLQRVVCVKDFDCGAGQRMGVVKRLKPVLVSCHPCRGCLCPKRRHRFAYRTAPSHGGSRRRLVPCCTP
jgi:hypothetical protein